MPLDDAIYICHVRAAVRRRSKPGVKYWKNHPLSIKERVPSDDALATDWEEYDPRGDEPRA